MTSTSSRPVPLTLGTALSAPASLFSPGHPGFEVTAMTPQALRGEALELADAVAAELEGAGRLGVAYSGGVDSATLLALAVRTLGAGTWSRCWASPRPSRAASGAWPTRSPR